MKGRGLLQPWQQLGTHPSASTSAGLRSATWNFGHRLMQSRRTGQMNERSVWTWAREATEFCSLWTKCWRMFGAVICLRWRHSAGRLLPMSVQLWLSQRITGIITQLFNTLNNCLNRFVNRLELDRMGSFDDNAGWRDQNWNHLLHGGFLKCWCLYQCLQNSRVFSKEVT